MTSIDSILLSAYDDHINKISHFFEEEERIINQLVTTSIESSISILLAALKDSHTCQLDTHGTFQQQQSSDRQGQNQYRLI